MILRPFRRSDDTRTIASLYGMIVAQARLPAFYADFGVPDTVQGRFDLIVLHLVLLLRRLAREGATGSGQGTRGRAGRIIGQLLFDAFCRDLDGNLREMGIGDLVVPKQMRRFGEAFYGRQTAYLAALQSADGRVFENALARNIYADAANGSRACALARYAREAVRLLDAQEEETLMRGVVSFPRPEAGADVRA